MCEVGFKVYQGDLDVQRLGSGRTWERKKKKKEQADKGNVGHQSRGYERTLFHSQFIPFLIKKKALLKGFKLENQ